MLDLGKSFEELAVRSKELDSNPWLLNCRNGSLNLRTGELQPHRREDLITGMVKVPYVPDAQCPVWTAFVTKIMGDDREKVGFLQRVVGYWLTGDTSEQCMTIFHGPGANGKTTFIEALRELLSDYARHTTTSSLLKSASSPIRNDLARLHSTRLVSAVEVGMGKKLDEALIKQLTGGDQVTARFLYNEYFEFKPQFKLVIAANHKPEIQGVDHGIWRRVILIPFDVTISEEEIDKDLLVKIREEFPGILAWAVQGCRDWLERGLLIPESVASATSEYRSEMDVVENFLEDCCAVEPSQKAALGQLFEAFRNWSNQACQDFVGKKAFGNLMRQKGFRQSKSGNVRYWDGVNINHIAPPAGSVEPGGQENGGAPMDVLR